VAVRHEIGERTVGDRCHRQRALPPTPPPPTPPARTAADTTTTRPGSTDGHTSPRGGSTEAGLLRMHGYRTSRRVAPLPWAGAVELESDITPGGCHGTVPAKPVGGQEARAETRRSGRSIRTLSTVVVAVCRVLSLARNRNRCWTALSNRPLDLSLWGGRAGWREANAKFTTDTLAPPGGVGP